MLTKVRPWPAGAEAPALNPPCPALPPPPPSYAPPAMSGGTRRRAQYIGLEFGVKDLQQRDAESVNMSLRIMLDATRK